MRMFRRVALLIALPLLLGAMAWAGNMSSADMQGDSQSSMAASSGGAGAAGPQGMMGGGSMGMMCSMPAIAVDSNSVYVVSGSTVYKYDKNTMQLVAQGAIPAPGTATATVQPSAPATSGAAGTAMPMVTSQNPDTQREIARMQAMRPSSFEMSFLQQMQARARGAATMSRLAAVKAQNPQIRDFAQTAVKDQNSQVARLGQWQMDWYDTSTRIRPVKTDQDAIGRLNSLQGADFDRAYTQAMISNYTDQIDMARLAETKADHRQLKSDMSTVMQNRTSQLNQLCTWYSAK